MEDAIGGLIQIVAVAVAVLFSLSVHEFAHAWIAYLQGDDTARLKGRMTLNPVAHIDPVGTLLLPGILLLLKSPFLLGWAKPVPVNPYNLRNAKYGHLYVSLAGPVSNLVLFALAAIGMKVAVLFLPADNLLLVFLSLLMIFNFVLAFFNLLPIPPLDGSKIWAAFLPHKWQYTLERYGLVVLFLLLFAILPVFSRVVLWLFVWVLTVLQVPFILPM